MKIAVPREQRPNERRVAASPATVKKFVAMGCEVVIERSAGDQACFWDDEYIAAGGVVLADAGQVLDGADIVLKVQSPRSDELCAYASGQVLICMMNPLSDREGVAACAAAGLTAFAMELMPRISRAQNMDVLSSQANLAGYKAVLDAAEHFGRAFPMMMTAAGTVAPARVFVMGAGVAGLQATATARRLGAIVSATDVRLATKEQVESLGARFVMVDDEESQNAETEAGYAREMSEGYRQKQAALVAKTLEKQDIVITTALIPGRTAPVLITDEMIAGMRRGSVIVDLAVEAGGNCSRSRPGEVVDADGIKIVGHLNWPSRVPTDASSLYANNLFNFLSPQIDRENGGLNLDFEDEIVAGVLVSRDGRIVHPMLTDCGA